MKKFQAIVALSAALAITACSSADDPIMPDVIGTSLDVALTTLDGAGISREPEIEGGGLFGIVEEANWQVCSQSPAAGTAVSGTPQLVVERDCETGGAEPIPTPSPEATTTPESAPSETASEVPTVAYGGPAYEVVTVDRYAVMGALDQYWVFTDAVDTATATYRDDIKAIIKDVVLEAETTELAVTVVTDAEIIEAESVNTIADFMAAHDDAYWNDVMVPKEEQHWVATYTGGVDWNAGELSTAPAAYGIDWWPAGDYEHELWMAANQR
jgi:hypothetical protein